MPNRLAVLLGHDLRLQWRYGIFAAYAMVITSTGLVVYFLKDVLPSWFVGLMVFTDNSAIGFFFLGGMLLLERAENVRDTLAVTPVSGTEYLISKTVTLTLFALAAVTVVALVVDLTTNWPLYLVATAITSIFYLGFGAWMAVRIKTVTGYITSSLLYFFPVIVPAGVAFMEPMPLVFAVLPTAAQFDLVLAGLDGTALSPARLTILLVSSALGAILSFRLGVQALRREFGVKQ